MTQSWLPAHMTGALRLRHHVLGGRELGRARVLIDAESGERVHRCTKYPKDPDLRIRPTELLAARVAELLNPNTALRLSPS